MSVFPTKVANHGKGKTEICGFYHEIVVSLQRPFFFPFLNTKKTYKTKPKKLIYLNLSIDLPVRDR